MSSTKPKVIAMGTLGSANRADYLRSRNGEETILIKSKRSTSGTTQPTKGKTFGEENVSSITKDVKPISKDGKLPIQNVSNITNSQEAYDAVVWLLKNFPDLLSCRIRFVPYAEAEK